MRGKSFSSLFYLVWRVRNQTREHWVQGRGGRWAFMGWIMQRQSKHSASCRGKKGKFRWQQWLHRFTLGTHCVVTDLYQHTSLAPSLPCWGPPSAAPPLSAAAQLSIPGMSGHVCSAPPAPRPHAGQEAQSQGILSVWTSPDHKGLIYLKPFCVFRWFECVG